MTETTQVASAPKRAKNKGGRPRGAKTTNVSAEVALRSPEVKSLIEELVAKATAELTARLQEQRSTAGTKEAPSDQSLIRQLALNIAEISDQGSNRKRIAPEVMESRRLARERMESLVLDFAARGETPEYELTRAVYLAEELVAPTYVDRDHVMRYTKIEWPGVPNEGMVPKNDAARQIFGAFIESIGGATKNVTRETVIGQPKENASGLKVLHKPETREAAQVSRPRNSGVTKVGRRQSGDVIETAVLGTVAEPARQIA